MYLCTLSFLDVQNLPVPLSDSLKLFVKFMSTVIFHCIFFLLPPESKSEQPLRIQMTGNY